MRKFGLIGISSGTFFLQKYFTEKFLEENIQAGQYDNYSLTSIELIEELTSNEPDL